MRILVCGSRDFTDILFLGKILDDIIYERSEYFNTTIIEGGAKGADYLGKLYAKARYCNHVQYPADWNKHGKAAGFIRNQQMLDEGKPDLVVAFKGGTGTADMVRRARKAGVEVLEVPYDGVN